MKLFTPLVPDPDAVLARSNPLAKLGAALLLMAVLFVSADLLTPVVVLAGLLPMLPLTGLAPRVILARTWPLLLVAVSVGVLNPLFAPEQAGTLLHIGPVTVGGQNLVNGLALGLRLLTIAGVGVVTLATTEPTDLADALVQQLHLSPRFAVGALAALRLLPILADEWQIIRLARRARGVDAGRSPLAAVSIFFGELLTLLVSAIRRGTRLALAMEARGLGSRPCRGVARPQRLRAADWLLIVASALLAAGAVGAGLAAGTHRFVFA
ncbi:MAG: energy-coupling factor transporter transmembrane protein EcfT [Chloroflexota bacterium]|nr:energy-coupling factor transporter transmembrane protein EcfT [Chloroflexota bacterium]